MRSISLTTASPAPRALQMVTANDGDAGSSAMRQGSGIAVDRLPLSRGGVDVDDAFEHALGRRSTQLYTMPVRGQSDVAARALTSDMESAGDAALDAAQLWSAKMMIIYNLGVAIIKDGLMWVPIP